MVAVITGPFGTYDTMTFSVRIFFWPGLFGAALVVAYVLCAALFAWAPKLNVWVHDAIVSVAFSILFTPVVAQAMVFAGAVPASPLTLWAEMLVIATMVAAVQRVIKLRWPQLASHVAGTAVDPKPELVEPRLLRRLDGVVASQILRLTVQDHYVEVVLMGRPSQRILMRFGDAVDETEGLDGFCVHRSHWVVRAHVLGVVSENGREMVEMVDGSRVPVSRTYRPNLVEAGLIDGELRRAAG